MIVCLFDLMIQTIVILPLSSNSFFKKDFIYLGVLAKMEA